MFRLKKMSALRQERLPYLYLGAAGVLEFLFITMMSIPSYLGFYLAETYLIVPCLLFMGYALQSDLDTFSRRRVLLGVVAVSWFVISQIQHKLSGMDNQPIGNVFAVYLLAFPFAAVTNDRENTGLLCIGRILSAASLILVGCTVLLLLDLIPAGWQEYLYWDGARLCAFWHPNISACYFMVGMGFCTVFLIRAQKPLSKVLLAVAVAAQFLAMALTNCRTTLLMTGTMLGGIAFFRIFRGNWKRLIPGFLAAVLILVGSFKFSGAIYQWNENRIVFSLYGVLQEVRDEQILEDATDSDATELYEEEDTADLDTDGSSVETDAQVTIQSKNPQDSLAKDMVTLNRRTDIWSSALKAIRDNRTLSFWGTEYTGTVVSAYSPFAVEHSHNSWVEVLLRSGLPGLLIALVFTVISVVSAMRLLLNLETELWKKIIAMTTLCVMVAGFLEPYLFASKTIYHVIDFLFFFLTGYLDYWCRPGVGKKQ